MSKFHQCLLLKGTVSTPAPSPSYVMDLAFCHHYSNYHYFYVVLVLDCPFLQGLCICISGRVRSLIFSPLGFLGFSYQADAPRISTSPLQAHTTSDLTVIIFQVVYFSFFPSVFRFIFHKLSTNFVPWLFVSYVHGNKRTCLPIIFIFRLNWWHCLTLFILLNLPACWGYNSGYIILIILLIYITTASLIFGVVFSLLGGIPALRVSVAVKSA